MMLPITVVVWVEKLIPGEIFKDLVKDDTLKNFREYWFNSYRAVVFRIKLVFLLMKRYNLTTLPISWKFS